jgi:hypothetical protein
MMALVISVPDTLARAGADYRSFEQTVSSGAAVGFAISDPDRRQIRIGSKLVLLDKPGERRAEANITKFELNQKTKTGMQTYNVHFEKAERVDYKPEHINRWGTSVIDSP